MRLPAQQADPSLLLGPMSTSAVTSRSDTSRMLESNHTQVPACDFTVAKTEKTHVPTELVFSLAKGGA